ncbi:MAG: type II toxin-antitoxin system VapC family toxin [Rhodoferax sp.]|nr:type II toxin-antitoxin system VapC family toxin [Rhodoferax sp.]
MNEARVYLLDTNTISQMMREPAGRVTQKFATIASRDLNHGVVTSTIVLCELQFGLQRKPNSRLSAALDRILSGMDALPLDIDVVSHYAQLRTQLEQKGTPIGPNDTLIAAHALALNATLVTADAEFSRVPGLIVENWLEPL